MTRSLLLGAAVAVLLCAAASAPGLSQARFQGGVSVSAGDIDNATRGRKGVASPTPAQQRAKRKGPAYTNKFECIPSSCAAGGSRGPSAVGKRLRLLPP